MSANTYLYGHTVFENAIIKFTNSAASPALRVRGTAEFRTGDYTPLICTAQDDNSIGENLPWSTGNPWTSYYANPALEFDSYASGQVITAKHVRVSHAYSGISFFTGYGHELRHAQFVHCSAAFVPYWAEARARNILVAQAERVMGGSGTASATMRFEHLTVDQADYLIEEHWFGPACNAFLTNSLLVAVANAGTYTGANNASNTTSASVFQTIGAGAHYLAGTAYRGAGTLNINPQLLGEVRARTTHPPSVQTNGWIVTDVTLHPRASIRYNNPSAVPDLGYHFPLLDFVLSCVYVTNATLKLNPGVAVGCAVPLPGWYGILLFDGGRLIVEGSPTNLVHLVRNNLVQEQANTNWGFHGPSVVLPWWSSTPPVEARFRFAQMAVPGESIVSGYGLPGPVSFMDCQLSGGSLSIPSSSPVGITNCLIEGVDLFMDAWMTPEVAVRNNLFRQGSIEVFDYSPTVTFRDNFFDQTTILYWNDVENSHNAYMVGSSRLFPTNGNDKVLASAAYEVGPLGRFYLPASSPLLNAGSQSAATSQLYHYTTTANQTKEAGSIVDIGLHWIALDGQNKPLDSDADLVWDYLEDLNGSGTQDAGETSHTVADTDNDGDGLTNSQELLLGTWPTKPDTDGDGILDPDEDSDDDRVTDFAELNTYNSDPLDPFSLDPNDLRPDGDILFAIAFQPAGGGGLYLTGPTIPQAGYFQFGLVGASGPSSYSLYFRPVQGPPWIRYAPGNTVPTTSFLNVNPGGLGGYFRGGWDGENEPPGQEDGLSSGYEFFVHGSLPNARNSDGDGVHDGVDAFPTHSSASVDTDGDGMPDDFHMNQDPNVPFVLTLDMDDDNDGIPDLVERPASGPQLSDPKNPNSIPPPRWFVNANTLYPIDGDGSAQLPFPTIQQAINAASDYDVIQVNGGRYQVAPGTGIAFISKKVILVSLRGWEETVLDGTQQAPTLNSAGINVTTPGSGTVVRGFTITNCSRAILMQGSSATFIDCTITGCGPTGAGGAGAFLRDASASFINCRFIDNFVGGTLKGAAIRAEASAGGIQYTSRFSHCTFLNNLRPAGAGQIYVRDTVRLEMKNCIVWSDNTAQGAEIIEESPGVATATFSDVRAYASPTGYFNIDLNPQFETGPAALPGRLTRLSPCKDRGTTNGVAGYGHVTRFDADGEARLLDSTPNILFNADIGADEFVYRIAFPTVATPETRRFLLPGNQVAEQTLFPSEVDEASGIAYLGNDTGGHAVIAVVDDEREEDFVIYKLNLAGDALEAQTFPIPLDNPAFTGSEDQVLDVEGIAYDDASRTIYLTTSHTKARQYRGVEHTILDPLTLMPTNDYDRRRNMIVKIPMDPDLVTPTAGASRYYSPEATVFPDNIIYNPSDGLIGHLRTSLNMAPWTAQDLGNNVVIAWNTVNKFGDPAAGTDPPIGTTFTEGGTVLAKVALSGASPPPEYSATHTPVTPGVTYYYKMWIRAGSSVATYTYRPYLTANAVARGFPTLLINEFVADSGAGTDDWIELFNPSPVAVNLNGYRWERIPEGQNGLDAFTILPAAINTIAANGYRVFDALNVTPPTMPENLTFTLPQGVNAQGNPEGGQMRILTPAPASQEVDRWAYQAAQRQNQSEGRTWDGGPSGKRARPNPQDQLREAVKYQPVGTFPATTRGAQNHGVQRNSFIAASDVSGTVNYLCWRLRQTTTPQARSPAVWDYSPKDHDHHPINVEGFAFCPARPGIAQPEMIVGMRSPLAVNRTNGNALFFRVTAVNTFLPLAGGWTVAATGVSMEQQIDLRGQGFRSIEWCVDGLTNTLNQAVQRYLIIGGPANGGPLEKETVGEKFSLYVWDGVAMTPQVLLDDLRPYTVRPEGVDILQVNGQWRIMFAEDRLHAPGYGRRNAIHWPVTILPKVL